MNTYYRIALLIFFCGSFFLLQAVHPVKEPIKPQAPVISSSMTVNEFLAIDPNLIRKSNGIKQAAIKRWFFRHAQQQLKKKVVTKKLAGETQLYDALDKNNNNKRGKAAFIIGGIGLVFMFLGPLAFISLPLAIASIILGVMGIQRDKNPTMGILGVVLGGLIILIFLFAIFVLLTLFKL